MAGAAGPIAAGLLDPPVQTALDHLRVLCIDDDADSLAALGELLRRWGVQVSEASNYRRACELLLEFEPQVLLVDYLLDTELDGFDVITELRRLSRPDLPAAVVSATRSDFLRDQAESQHCELFLKPVKPALLKAWLSLLPTPHK
jgi:CheY-like chemotaxis protein